MLRLKPKTLSDTVDLLYENKTLKRSTNGDKKSVVKSTGKKEDLGSKPRRRGLEKSEERDVKKKQLSKTAGAGGEKKASSLDFAKEKQRLLTTYFTLKNLSVTKKKCNHNFFRKPAAPRIANHPNKHRFLTKGDKRRLFTEAWIFSNIHRRPRWQF